MPTNGVVTGSVLLQNQLNISAGGGFIEEIQFYDTSTYDLLAQDYTMTGTTGNDTLYGAAAASSSGSDTIYGGSGNDTIYGYAPEVCVPIRRVSTEVPIKGRQISAVFLCESEAARVVAGSLEANGREVYYTENEEYGHTVWVPTYDDPEFWYWLLQQRKS